MGLENDTDEKPINQKSNELKFSHETQSNKSEEEKNKSVSQSIHNSNIDMKNEISNPPNIETEPVQTTNSTNFSQNFENNQTTNSYAMPTQTSVLPTEYLPPTYLPINQEFKNNQYDTSSYLQNNNLDIYNNIATPQIYDSKQIQYAEILPIRYMPTQTQIVNEQNTYSQTQYSLYQPQTQSFSGAQNQFIQTGSTYEQPIYQPSQFIQTNTTSEQPKYETNISNAGYQTTDFVTSQNFGTTQNNVPNASTTAQLNNNQNTEIKQSQNQVSQNNQFGLSLSGNSKEEFLKEYNKLEIQKTQILKDGENPINEESKKNNNLENESKDNKIESNNATQEQNILNQDEEFQKEVNATKSQFDALKVTKTRYLSEEEISKIMKGNESNNNTNNANDNNSFVNNENVNNFSNAGNNNNMNNNMNNNSFNSNTNLNKNMENNNNLSNSKNGSMININKSHF